MQISNWIVGVVVGLILCLIIVLILQNTVFKDKEMKLLYVPSTSLYSSSPPNKNGGTIRHRHSLCIGCRTTPQQPLPHQLQPPQPRVHQ